jgi:hypothetical protein
MPTGQPLTEEEVHSRISEINGSRIWMVPGTYVNTRDYAWFECENNHRWEARVNSVINCNKVGCRKCFNRWARKFKRERQVK